MKSAYLAEGLDEYIYQKWMNSTNKDQCYGIWFDDENAKGRWLWKEMDKVSDKNKEVIDWILVLIIISLHMPKNCMNWMIGMLRSIKIMMKFQKVYHHKSK